MWVVLSHLKNPRWLQGIRTDAVHHVANAMPACYHWATVSPLHIFLFIYLFINLLIYSYIYLFILSDLCFFLFIYLIIIMIIIIYLLIYLFLLIHLILLLLLLFFSEDILCMRLVFGVNPRHAYINPIVNIWPHPSDREQGWHNVTLHHDIWPGLRTSGHLTMKR